MNQTSNFTLIDEKQTAKMLGMTRQWLQATRVRGGGPTFIKIGRAVRYDVATLTEWIEARRLSNTGQRKVSKPALVTPIVRRKLIA